MSGEQYKLRCFSCHSEIQIPTTQRECSKCGQRFEIDWSAEREAYVGPQGGQNLAERELRDREPDRRAKV